VSSNLVVEPGPSKEEPTVHPRFGVSAVIPSKSIIPILVIDDVSDAVPLARCLADAGVRILEVTLRTPAALAALERISSLEGGLVVGAGTVLDRVQLKAAENAGARFAVSPGYVNEVARAAAETSMAYLPGVATASEILSARSQGLRELKLFPARQIGGIGALRQFQPVFPDIRFCPTGGVTEQDIGEYLAEPNVFATGAGWLASPDLVRTHAWGDLSRQARSILQACSAGRGASL
jgi:2-dehydro-3-deoxyphosphogluconate aldolase/(4S)-4-hydroxy-2-oxoglutarate aldolase